MVYNLDAHIYQFCDGTNWIAMGPATNPTHHGTETETNVACVVGNEGYGGIFAACDGAGVTGYHLIATPGGCGYNASDPQCSGTDQIGFFWSGDTNFNECCLSYNNDGRVNTHNAVNAKKGVYVTGTEYCAALLWGGYGDWYLPAQNELHDILYPNRVAIGGFNTGTYSGLSYRYQSSRQYDADDNCQVQFNNGIERCKSDNENDKYDYQHVRCVRREQN